MAWFTGKGYGISDTTDVTGRPLLTYQGANDKRPFLLSDRVAQTFDFTIAQPLTAGAMKNDRMDGSLATYIKTRLGGGSDDELDHKISLELGGSNTPANLWIQPGIKSGASAASDQLENNLAIDVANGRISLLTAWRTLAEQKGFLLGEDSNTGTTFSIAEAATAIYGIAQQAIGGNLGSQIHQLDATLKKQIADDTEKLKQDPLNQKLQTSLFFNNVKAVGQQLGISDKEAGGVVKSYLGNYAKSKNIDPRELNSALNANIQQIIDNSMASPNVFGIPSTSIIRIVGAMQALGGLAIGGGVILIIIALFTVGWETALAALAEGGLSLVAQFLGLTVAGSIGLGAVAAGSAITVMGIALNMTVKEMYDNAYLLPTQQIGALKDALAAQKGLAAFLPSAVPPPGTASSVPGTGGGGSSGGTSPTLFVGHIDRGQLVPVVPFKPIEASVITNFDTLASTAQQNLAAFLSALPALLSYQIKTKTVVVQDDGTEAIGSVRRIQTGTTKKGVAKYKNLTDKFAVAEIIVQSGSGKKVLLEEVILGLVDSSAYKPTVQEMGALGNALSKQLITTDIGAVHTIQTNPAVAATVAALATPQQISAVQAATAATAAAVANPTPATVAAAASAIAGAEHLLSPTPAPAVQTPPPATASLPVTTLQTQSVPFSQWTDAQLAAYHPFPNAPDFAAFSAEVDRRNAIKNPNTSPQPLGSFSRMVTVAVSKLYVRAQPNTQAALAGSQSLLQGQQFQATGWALGENVSGESRWWISFRGDYVWSGGTTEKPY